MNFQMSETEAARTKAWIEQHAKDHVMTYTGAIGGRWIYTFVPTSIGDLIQIRCAGCGQEAEISDLAHPEEELG